MVSQDISKHLIKAMQKLDAQNAALQERIETLAKENQSLAEGFIALQDRLDKLEAKENIDTATATPV